jgi:hypothetical protein
MSLRFYCVKLDFKWHLQSPYAVRFKYPFNPKEYSEHPQDDAYCIDIPSQMSWFESKIDTCFSVEFDVKPIRGGTNPFLQTSRGSFFDKYTHIACLRTNFFAIYYYMKEVIQPCKKAISSLNDINRNKYILIDGNTYRVIKIEESKYALENVGISSELVKSELKLKKFKRKKTCFDQPIMFCYDIETVQFGNKLVPFIISCRELGEGGEHFLWKKQRVEFSNPLWPTCEFYEGVELFCSWLYRTCQMLANYYGYDNPCHVRLFGYNNHNFDNHLVVDGMRRAMKGFTYKYSARFGKTTGFSFTKQSFTLSICDLIRWFPATPLSKACKDNSISAAKYDVDILTYCNDCSASQRIITHVPDLQVYFKTPIDAEFASKYKRAEQSYAIYDLVVDYCERDVEATLELFVKLNANMQTLFNVFQEMDIHVPHRDIFAYISPPQMAFSILKDMLAADNQQILSFKHDEQSNFIYKAYMGGRCQTSIYGECAATPGPNGEPGEYLYVDVTSEYPTAMKGYFPDVRDPSSIFIGSEIDLPEVQGRLDRALAARNDLFNRKLLHTTCSYLREINSIKGFFECNVYPPEDERLLPTWAPIGTRLQMEQSVKLFFLNCAQSGRILTTAHWMALILAGWRVELVENTFNILFTSQSQLIKNYIDIVGRKKTESVNNKTMRNLYKLLLNSLYGYLVQKPRHLLHTQKAGIRDNGEVDVYANEKHEKDDWSCSYHYIGAYVTAYSNFIVFQACYKAELHLLYEYAPLELRTNICLYTDTDSVILNKWKMSSFGQDFLISEEIGTWDEEAQQFAATWKYEEFAKPIRRLIVLSKKSYYLLAERGDNTLMCIKAKGIHSHMAKKLTYDIIKSVAQGGHHQIEFSGLVKRNVMLDQSVRSFEFAQDCIKTIHEGTIRKTLSRDHLPRAFEIVSADPLDLQVNHENLAQLPYTNTINHFLKYTCSIRQKNHWEIERAERYSNLDKIIDNIAEDNLSDDDDDE